MVLIKREERCELQIQFSVRFLLFIVMAVAFLSFFCIRHIAWILDNPSILTGGFGFLLLQIPLILVCHVKGKPQLLATGFLSGGITYVVSDLLMSVLAENSLTLGILKIIWGTKNEEVFKSFQIMISFLCGLVSFAVTGLLVAILVSTIKNRRVQ